MYVINEDMLLRYMTFMLKMHGVEQSTQMFATHI